MHPSPLVAWESFYVIVGSSAGALTGLQFVVMALVAEQGLQGSGRQISAFGTPTVVHFCVVLLLGAILTAPWHGLSGPALTLGALGVAGIVYGLVTILRAVRQSDYKPVFEDWVWHTVLPFVSYAAILLGSIRLTREPLTALFTLAGAAMLLLFVGIHNAWDTVTYVVTTQAPARKEPEKRA
jgi:hypothetical protein